MKSIVIAGEFIVIIEPRQSGEDGGPSLSLLKWVPPHKNRHQSPGWKTIWRADLFRQDPHHHIFSPHLERNERIELSAGVSNLIAWCLAKLGNLKELLKDDYQQVVGQKDQASIDQQFPLIKHYLEEAQTTTQET